MQEGDYRPQPVEAAPIDRGGDSTGISGTTSPEPLKTLVEGKQFKFKSPIDAYDKLLDVTVEAGAYDDMPDTIVESLHDISIAYGILAYQQFPDNLKELFLTRLDRHRETYQADQIELSLEEALMLQKVTQAVKIEYDPGTEETTDKRTFPFSQVEQFPPENVSSYWSISKDRSKPPEPSTIVERNTPSIKEDPFEDW